MRGKDSAAASAAGSPGITPAYAGKREKRVEKIPQIWDHPRVCGEKLWRCCTQICMRGSPPRMRGKEGSAEIARTLAGITPAYAGKSPGSVCVASRKQDHPRVCGEKAGSAPFAHRRTGSPPRMRGKEIMNMAIVHDIGITPAYAGKSKTFTHVDVRTGITPAYAGKRPSDK